MKVKNSLERRMYMKVKIGDVIFNSEDQPIMLILDEKERGFITNMGDQNNF